MISINFQNGCYRSVEHTRAEAAELSVIQETSSVWIHTGFINSAGSLTMPPTGRGLNMTCLQEIGPCFSVPGK